MEQQEGRKLVALKSTVVDRAHMDLIRSYLAERLDGTTTITDSAVLRWALDRAARGIYAELTGGVPDGEAK